MLKTHLKKIKNLKKFLIGFIFLIPSYSFFIEPSSVFAEDNSKQLQVKKNIESVGSLTTELNLLSIGQKKSNTFTLKKIGLEKPILLRGIDSQESISFKIRTDEVVTKAKLNLRFYYSNHLLSELSQINILLNGEPLDAINIEDGQGGQQINKSIEIPKELVTDVNNLTFQLVGHYSKECEDPRDSRLWSVISNLSSIEIESNQFVLQNDLQFFPLPFIDPQDTKRSSLAFVFLNKLTKSSLEAAGILASYFGSISDNNNIDFLVNYDNIPKKGNAIIFTDNLESFNGLNKSSTSSPTNAQLTILSNPNDSEGKLLIIYGKNSDEQKNVVLSLISSKNKFSGNLVEINSKPTFQVRKPYDSPAWLSSYNKVKFSQLYPNIDSLNATSYGSSTFPVDIKLPPDLYGIKDKNSGINLNLVYRYDEPNSSKGQSAKLIISANEQLIRAVSLNGAKGDFLNRFNFFKTSNSDEMKFTEGSLSVNIPVEQQNNLLKLKPSFNYNYPNKLDCVDNLLISSTKQSINPNSTVDISNLSHFVKMPNLAIFKTHGYPFSRMADLSDTSFIFTDSFSPESVKSYLTILSWLGNSVRYPAISLSVNDEQETALFSDKDLIIFNNNMDNSTLLKKWNVSQMFQQKPNSIINSITTFFSSYLTTNKDTPSSDEIYNPQDIKASILEFQSPLSNNRTVVLFSSKADNGFSLINSIFGETDTLNGKVYGSHVLITDNAKLSFVSENYYYLGSLNPLESFNYFLSSYPLLFIFFTIIAILLLTLISYFLLRNKLNIRKKVD